MRARQFVHENSDAITELDLYINNNEDLYRRRFMPIAFNLQRKFNKKIHGMQ